MSCHFAFGHALLGLCFLLPLCITHSPPLSRGVRSEHFWHAEIGLLTIVFANVVMVLDLLSASTGFPTCMWACDAVGYSGQLLDFGSMLNERRS